ncbi:hypothetical protein [Chitinophaga sp. RAB17]|uniref:hypothetical protein n=1 Tax=Chitinophaga sp. RAB17 TaxID=3233049 RepID=UPI003F93E85B
MKILYTICALVAGMLVLSSCSKKDDFYYKENVVTVKLKGYNGSDEYLDVKLDTFSFVYYPNSAVNETMPYSFTGSQESVKLRITEQGTGKLVLEKILKKNDGLVKIGLLYLDGKAADLPQVPAIEEGKIKIRYIFRPIQTNYSEPVDIALVKYYFTPKVSEEIGRIKNVKPNELSEPISISTFSTSGQVYNGQKTPVLFRAYIYKAGTNEFYTDGTAYTWNTISSAVPLPSPSATAARVYIFSEEASDDIMGFTKNLEL